MTFSDFNSHTNPLFMDLKLLKVREIIMSQQLKLAYEFYKNKLPSNIQNLFRLDSNIHNYETNSSAKHLFHIPQIITTSYGNKSLKYRCPILWNSTIKNKITIDSKVTNNVSIDKIHNTHHFKRILKKYYLYMYSLV